MSETVFDAFDERGNVAERTGRWWRRGHSLMETAKIVTALPALGTDAAAGNKRAM